MTTTPGGPTPQQPYAPHGAPTYSTPPPAGHGPYGTGPAPAVPPAPPKRSWFARHKILTALLAIVALVVIGNLINGGGSSPETDAVPAASPTSDPADAVDDAASADDTADTQPVDANTEQAEAPADDTPGIGDPARDGKFEFVVTGVEAGGNQIGSEFLNEQAQGQFMLVHLTVTNIGDVPQSLFDSNQTLVDSAGRQHATNSMAGLYLEDNDTFFNEINPGNTVAGTLVFDIPTDAVPASIELHDSMFSGGVTVSLG